jgi:hypothetical protein
LAISEHGLKDDEITQYITEDHAAVSRFCRKECKQGGVAIYSSKNILQYTCLKWITEKITEKPYRSYWCRTDRCKEKITIALYRSASGVLCKFFVHLIDILEQLVQKDCYIILV